jgi:NAD-dependent dihydropyrimidine dehydrogenase PreA subunit
MVNTTPFRGDRWLDEAAFELSMIDLPLLDWTRCNSCSQCVAACPVDCLEMDGPMPWLPRPADCVACGLCALVCPEDALQILPVDQE